MARKWFVDGNIVTIEWIRRLGENEDIETCIERIEFYGHKVEYKETDEVRKEKR